MPSQTREQHSDTTNLLEVSQLNTQIHTSRGSLRAIQDVSFSLKPGEILGLVGESGSGKSVTLRSLLRLMPSSAEISGSVKWQGREISTMKPAELRSIRGGEIAMIFQEPMIALNPVLTVWRQVEESLRAHTDLNRKQRRQRAIELLNQVGIPAPELRLDDYPHQFSGGMRQRVMIAIALAGNPRLLLADEPTTALDVTIQEQILKLLFSLRERLGMGIIFVTHDLGVVAQLCDRVAVMYAGRIVETAPVAEIFSQPRHPYTQGLIASVPQNGGERKPLQSIEGTPPSLLNLPQGCSFSPRCRYKTDVCLQQVPPLESLNSTHQVACYHHASLSPSASLKPLPEGI
ncbi:ABC transporter ATP-binding protein [Rouxiella badensis]|jgi:oligopeptide/dipeptide ABC transporter ATP-binding protein|uniref:Methionine ABC transporter ATP-binding protein n=1 Tax=Rouxiella badensis TaxID=1646377 RepID=A0A1X0WEW9_9GAMM|nr:ABC transporter ATP-binding protein [Rouxiella badensis]MCC3703799.1 ABC transporter ATP-binding protein [Rouxiella badensis]MCC3719827.1 ABC transporter ATP-binding protein [Rouxiella badensis]MCC3729321.1 ABC transporter ATP-binding protein [Rouxiella badensis]MCC3734737.1 ABC transporter ATP-binding protein [Rouxiella badensis]MCC3741488.1 ABC transporter ATP-binding protein [Rouxiella badensis]